MSGNFIWIGYLVIIGTEGSSVHAGLHDQNATGIAALLIGESDDHVGLWLIGLYNKILWRKDDRPINESANLPNLWSRS